MLRRQRKRSCLGRVLKEQSFLFPLYLLLVVGRVREEGGHMEHDLVVLVRRVQGVGARGVRCRRKKGSVTIVCRSNAALWRGNVTPSPTRQW